MATVCLQTCTHPPLLDDALCHIYTVTVQNSSAKFRAKICYTTLEAVAAQSRRELFLVPDHVFYPRGPDRLPTFHCSDNRSNFRANTCTVPQMLPLADADLFACIWLLLVTHCAMLQEVACEKRSDMFIADVRCHKQLDAAVRHLLLHRS